MVFCLCGCDTGNKEPEQTTLVSAIGFDDKSGKICITVETIKVSEESNKSSYEPFVLRGEGGSVEEALSNIYSVVAGKLLFYHCGLIIIGESVSAGQFDEIMSFCQNEEEITLSAMLISTENAYELLSCQKSKSSIIGYNILSILKEKQNPFAFKCNNKFYETETFRKTGGKTFALPSFSVTEENGEKSFQSNGLKIFCNNYPVFYFNKTQSLIYEIFKNDFSNKYLILDCENNQVNANVAKAACYIKPELTDENINLNFNIKITLKKEQPFGFSDEKFNNALNSAVKKFLSTIKNDINTDVLDIQTLLQKKYPEILHVIGNDNINSCIAGAEYTVLYEIKRQG